MHATTTLPSVINLNQDKDGKRDIAAFSEEVAQGLGQTPKKLSSRYFYDGVGSKLFQKIMDLPEYYLTRCELEVLTENRVSIADRLSKSGFFHLVDLGAGDAMKTKVLLNELGSRQIAFDYLPVDISEDAMHQLSEDLDREMPGIKYQAVVGEYFKSLEWLQHNKERRKVILFLGSNIGNFEYEESMTFLQKLRTHLKPGDSLLMGVDLRKDPDTILRAYNDPSGTTAAFNLNLLHRINKELGGEFDVDQFRHYALYNPQDGVMRSYLISKQEQEVYIGELQQSFHFDAWEAIHTENSHKYTLDQIEELGKACGFSMETVFQDKQCRFANVLFTAR